MIVGPGESEVGRGTAALLLLTLLASSLMVWADEKPKRVDVVGTLRTGIVAIGGETTGVTITGDGFAWELDFKADPALSKEAERLSGRKVRVRGLLELRQGVEIKKRWIVTVSGLEPVAGDEPPLGFQATLKRAGARVRFLREGETTVIDIVSKSGINSATLRRTADSWPRSIMVRLHLSGLEKFTAGVKDTAVEWSVSSTAPPATRVVLLQGDRESPLGRESPYYGALRMVGGNGKIPLKDGHFEVTLPPNLFENSPRELILEWIDFYR